MIRRPLALWEFKRLALEGAESSAEEKGDGANYRNYLLRPLSLPSSPFSSLTPSPFSSPRPLSLPPKKNMKIVFDKVLPKWNYRAVPKPT